MEWIEPMEPVLRSDIPDGVEWLHQVKWDGIRGLCYVDNGKLNLFTKRGRNRTPYYPEVQGILKLMHSKSAVFDGEIISLNDQDKPSFQRMQIRERVSDISRINYYRHQYPIRYIVFDMLSLDGKLITSLPFTERITLLNKTLERSDIITITDSFTYGEALFALMKEKNWEGIVTKNTASPYTGGKAHRDWYKTKISKKLLAVICGLSMKEQNPNSLVLGINRGQGLEYIGKASIGLTQDHFRLLKESIPQLMSEEPVFKIPHPDLKGIVWLKPLITLWVGFMEWTNDGSIRHPKIEGFSSDPPDKANGEEFVD